MKLTKGHETITCQYGGKIHLLCSSDFGKIFALFSTGRRWTSTWKSTAMNFSTRLAEKLPGILPVPSHSLLRKGCLFQSVSLVSFLWPHPGFVYCLFVSFPIRLDTINVKRMFLGFSSFVISTWKSPLLSETFVSIISKSYIGTFVSESNMWTVMVSGRWKLMSILFSRVSGAVISELRFFATANHSRRLRLGLQKNKVWSLQRAELSVVTNSCIVHPATEAYAQEAIEAIKSEKVIAVPTDTLYGFACDAW